MRILPPLHSNRPQPHQQLHRPSLPPPPPQAESSSNTSQSFTQWRFPLSNSPMAHQPYSQPKSDPESEPLPDPEPDTPPLTAAALEELFLAAEIRFGSGGSGPPAGAVAGVEPAAVEGCCCPAAVVACLREGVARKAASKVLLALCLVEGNRLAAVAAVVEALADAESALAERSMAALELLCTTAEGAEEVRAHALAVPMMVQLMGEMEGGRGKEHAISMLAVIYGGAEEGAAAVEVARAGRVQRGSRFCTTTDSWR
ncbi:uncharacterized protein LOC121741276 [Salvia splendens]|uniref:uncharacterized protein LOC121741276 n=1 Tax=Salvia splendens TaxID=180675 RepID=UPI001102BC83|nr:uncharacterized protein LOC121741276 [Salvia splendens]